MLAAFMSGAGLTPRVPSPPPRGVDPEDVITEEAGVRPPVGHSPRVTVLVEEGENVAQGAPVACLRDAPEVCFVAPMAGRVARISLLPGHRLSEIVMFREGDDVHTTCGSSAEEEPGLRRLMQVAGIWPMLRRRPFGGMPGPDERPAAIIVMAIDTKPFAPDPRQALEGREEDFARGVAALTRLTGGPVFVCQETGADLVGARSQDGRVRVVDCAPRHPQGSAGIRIHNLAPATIEAPVWDIHAEDVAALGACIETGILPMTRLVRVAGTGLREGRLVRTQPGADLRGLTHRVAHPGAQVLMSGSPLDGHEAHWLAPRDRQVTVLPRPGRSGPPHWLIAALTQSARPMPVIPTSALTQAFGAELPAAPFVRALSSGDDETAMKLGVLSFLEEDVALADYVLGGEAHLTALLRGMLDRIQVELAA